MFKDLEKSEVQDEAETQMNKSIIVIGGESAEEMTCMTRIDEYIVAVSGKARPTVLYISTANGDDRLKISDFITKYESIGCTVICLTFLFRRFPTLAILRRCLNRPMSFMLQAGIPERCWLSGANLG